MSRNSISDEGLARIAALGLKPEQLPRHVAIIMDGNGRWAQARGLPRIMGHRRGIQSVRAVVEEGCRLGLDQLTLYCLSVENWKRPPRELQFLMRLLRHFLKVERAELMEQNVRLTMIGRREGLPDDVLARVRSDRAGDVGQHRDDPLPGGQLRRPDRDRRRRPPPRRGRPRRRDHPRAGGRGDSSARTWPPRGCPTPTS